MDVDLNQLHLHSLTYFHVECCLCVGSMSSMYDSDIGWVCPEHGEMVTLLHSVVLLVTPPIRVIILVSLQCGIKCSPEEFILEQQKWTFSGWIRGLPQRCGFWMSRKTDKVKELVLPPRNVPNANAREYKRSTVMQSQIMPLKWISYHFLILKQETGCPFSVPYPLRSLTQ